VICIAIDAMRGDAAPGRIVDVDGAMAISHQFDQRVERDIALAAVPLH
jgi:hypothetical protein